jgi:hypothetical protein
MSGPDIETNLPALLAVAAASAERHRARIEPRLAAREAAARDITNATLRLVTAHRTLAEQSQALIVELTEAGIQNVPLARIETASLAAAVATEIWRLSTGPHPGSPLALPCVCAGAVSRPDILVPLAEVVRDANAIVRSMIE